MDSSNRPPRKWSSQEDQKLREEVEMQCKFVLFFTIG